MATRETAAASELSPLRSVHTASFPNLLNQLQSSLLVSTYQAGRLIVVRADGEELNTHFRSFESPMGLAANAKEIVLGTRTGVRMFRNMPAVTSKLEPSDKHDACYVPRSTHVTGDIRIHEIAWANKELWAVNTRFSCLCTFDVDHSFVPRWKPPFVSSYSPEDRCHLNGLGVRDGKVKYVTCLGTSDTRGGWRPQKAVGGALLDVPSGEPIAYGLSMPHSPRWHDGKLWVLNSGAGEVAIVDERSGRLTVVAKVPGFTRGLDFVGSIAFVGLSQVRESAVFSGIPIADLPKRECGVWVIDTRTGRTLGFLKFEDNVQEIFAVQVLRGLRYPEVMADNDKLLDISYVLPTEAIANVRLAASA